MQEGQTADVAAVEGFKGSSRFQTQFDRFRAKRAALPTGAGAALCSRRRPECMTNRFRVGLILLRIASAPCTLHCLCTSKRSNKLHVADAVASHHQPHMLMHAAAERPNGASAGVIKSQHGSGHDAAAAMPVIFTAQTETASSLTCGAQPPPSLVTASPLLRMPYFDDASMEDIDLAEDTPLRILPAPSDNRAQPAQIMPLPCVTPGVSGPSRAGHSAEREGHTRMPLHNQPAQLSDAGAWGASVAGTSAVSPAKQAPAVDALAAVATPRLTETSATPPLGYAVDATPLFKRRRCESRRSMTRASYQGWRIRLVVTVPGHMR